MALYSKYGSIPQPETDGTEGWIEVPDMPECPEGKEVVWWFPPGWVIRDPKPEMREGFVWKWNQNEEQWIEYELPPPAPFVPPPVEEPPPVPLPLDRSTDEVSQ